MESLIKIDQELENLYQINLPEYLIKTGSTNLGPRTVVVENAKSVYNALTEGPFKPLLEEYVKGIRNRLGLYSDNVPISISFIPSQLDKNYKMQISGGNGKYVIEVDIGLTKISNKDDSLLFYLAPLMNEIGHIVVDVSGGPPLDEQDMGYEKIFDIERSRAFAKCGFLSWANEAWDRGYTRNEPKPPGLV